MEENEEARLSEPAMEAIPQGGKEDEADRAKRWEEEVERMGRV